MQSKCLETLGKLSRAVEFQPPEFGCPDMEPLNQTQVTILQSYIQDNKALAWDGFSD